MESRIPGFLRAFVWVALLLLGRTVRGGLVRETSCGDDLLRLECRSRNSVLVIHQAYVTTDPSDGNLTCPQSSTSVEDNLTGYRELERSECSEDLRIAINRKCSGMKRCNYRYSTETWKQCDSKKSIVVVRYNCVKESSIYKFCNTRLQLKEGYISSPGYPLYYPHLKTCRWYLDASDGQIIVIQPLHVHIRGPTIVRHDEEYPIRAGLHPDVITCDLDYLRIEEGGHKVTDTCGEQVQGLRSTEIEASRGASVKFVSQEFFPASGFLIYFRVKGCATISPPEDVYLVKRDGTDALYRCLDGRAFNDTLSNSRLLRCVGEHRWNDTINVPCIEMDVVQLVTVNRSTDHGQKADLENMTNDQASGSPVSQKRTSYVEDIIVPSILMALLIIGNIIIIVIIFTIRRRHERAAETAKEDQEIKDVKDEADKEEAEDEEETMIRHKTTTV